MKDNFGNDVICESEGKICYTKKEARTALNRARHRGNRAKKIPKRKYFCEKCGCYHLTHQTFYKSDKPQREFRQKLRELITFENNRAWREECSLLCIA